MSNILKEKLFLSSSYDSVNSPWTIDLFTGILNYIDINNKKLIYSDFCGSIGEYSRFLDVLQVNSDLFFLPYQADENIYILKKNLHTKEKIKIQLRGIKEEYLSRKETLFTAMHRVDNYIYYISGIYPAIVRLNVNTLDVDYIDDWKTEIDEKINGIANYMYFNTQQCAVNNNEIFLPFRFVSAVLKINAIELTTEVVNIETDSEGFSCICEFTGDTCLLTGAGKNANRLYIWDINTNQIINTFDLQDNTNALSVIKMLRSPSGDVYLFPWQNWDVCNLDIYCLNKKDHMLHNTQLIEKHIIKNAKPIWGDEIIYANWKEENLFQYVTGRDLVWHEYNIETGKYIEYELNLDKDDDKYKKLRMEYYKDVVNQKQPIKEGELQLEDFLQL